VYEEEPARNLKNGEWGVRVTTTVAGWDLELSYLYAWEDLPYFESFPIGGAMSGLHTSSQIFLVLSLRQ